VLVGVHRDGRLAVAEPLADDVHWYPRFQQDRRATMPQSMQGDTAPAGVRDRAVELPAEPVRVGRPSVGMREDECGGCCVDIDRCGPALRIGGQYAWLAG